MRCLVGIELEQAHANALMRSYSVELQGSFLQDLSTLEVWAREGVELIMRELDQNPHFTPIGGNYEEQYVFEHTAQMRACQHVNGWGGWKLIWSLEMYELEPLSVEFVLLFLRRGSLQILKAKV
jgi:hypothetical protein